MDQIKPQNECRRCGTCCEKGGPALHTSDLPLLEQGAISPEDLITIRKGELAHDPASNAIQPVKKEFVKIRGKKNSWTCMFYEKNQNGCTIYSHRPLACRVLKCWDTKDILELSGKDLLSRLDVVKMDDPLREKMIAHEKQFPCPDLGKMYRPDFHPSKKTVKKLEQISNRDILFRNRVIEEFNLSVAKEMFCFGRPVFQLLTAIGFGASETVSGIRLHHPRSFK